MSAKKLLVYGTLSAILAAGAFAVIGTAANPAFSQIYGDDDDSSRSTGTASGDATRLWGSIASIQRNDAGAPAWITSGHWRLEADRPVTDDDADAMVGHFSAVIHMASIRNGTDLHQHFITDFRQTGIQHSGGNVTMINGTMTVTMSDGPRQNVPGAIELQNNMMAIWLDPEELDEHFGPTPIYGLVLPDRFKIDDDDDWDDDDTTAAQRGLGDDDNGRDDDSAGTATQGFRDDDDDRDDDDNGRDDDDDDDAYDG